MPRPNRTTPAILRKESMETLVQTYIRDKSNLDREEFGTPLERLRVAKRMGLIRAELERRNLPVEALEWDEEKVDEAILKLEHPETLLEQ